MNHPFEYLAHSKILIVDDEPQLRKLLRMTLENYNVKIIEAVTAREGMEFSKTHRPDLVILDLNLGDLHGSQVLHDLRSWSNKPVIILSVENQSDEIVRLINLGADDFLTKPFSIDELLARTQACLRRTKKIDRPKSVFKSKYLNVDFDSRIVKVNDTEVKLTSTEFDLLKLFINNAGKVLTHRYILKEIWGPTHIEHLQYPRVYVRYLRAKIELNPDLPQFITTESGVGYRFIAKNEF